MDSIKTEFEENKLLSEAFDKLEEKYNYSHEDIAKMLGYDKTTVSNYINPGRKASGKFIKAFIGEFPEFAEKFAKFANGNKGDDYMIFGEGKESAYMALSKSQLYDWYVLEKKKNAELLKTYDKLADAHKEVAETNKAMNTKKDNVYDEYIQFLKDSMKPK